MLPDPRHFFSQTFWAIVCFGCIWCLVHFWVMPRLRRVYAERSDQADQWSRQAQNIEKKVMDIMKKQSDFELIFVDDGSSDRTY